MYYMAKYFPMFMDIAKKQVTVIGGGEIALRRIKTLLEFECFITVVALDFSEELKRLAEERDCIFLLQADYGCWRKKSNLVCFAEEKNDILYQDKLLYKKVENAIKSAFFILAATNKRATNHQIYLDAKKRKQLVNVCDAKEECDFYFPGVVTGKHIVIGVTASGTSHKLAKEVTNNIREKREEIIDQYEKDNTCGE